MHITPYLAMVLAAFGTFIVVLGGVWMWNALADLRRARAAR